MGAQDGKLVLSRRKRAPSTPAPVSGDEVSEPLKKVQRRSSGQKAVNERVNVVRHKNGWRVAVFGPTRSAKALAHQDQERARAARTPEAMLKAVRALRDEAEQTNNAAQAPRNNPDKPASERGGVSRLGNKWRMQVYVKGQNATGPVRDTKELAQQDLEQARAAQTPEAMQEAVRALSGAPKQQSERAKKRQRHDHAHGLFERRLQEEPACALSHMAMATLIFRLWTGVSRPQDRDLKQCLAQVAILSYMGACRLGEIIKLKSEYLNQRAKTFRFLQTKRFGDEVYDKKKLPPQAEQVAIPFLGEERDWSYIWERMALDKPLLFARRWRDADAASKQFAKQTIGLEFEDMEGNVAHLTGHMFRRSRGVHFMTHNPPEKEMEAMGHMQLKYGHRNISTTEGYVKIKKEIRSWMGSVSLSEGVFAHLAAMLKKHDSMSATGPAE